MQNINWYLFTNEERSSIQKAIDSGDVKNIACVVDTVMMDPDKELEIQKIVDNMTPEDDNFISEVEPVMAREFVETPEPDKTPEQEAEWQAKLDAERKDFVEKKKKGKTKKEKVEEIIINKEEVDSKENTKSTK